MNFYKILLDDARSITLKFDSFKVSDDGKSIIFYCNGYNDELPITGIIAINKIIGFYCYDKIDSQTASIFEQIITADQ